MWSVKFVNENAEGEFMRLPPKLKAKMAQDMLLLCEHGKIGGDLTKKLGGELFELRTKAAEGIARGIYAYEKGRIVLMLVVFVKKSQKTPSRYLDLASERLKEYKDGER